MAKSWQPGQTRMSARSAIYQLQHFYIQLRERVQKLNLEADRCKEKARDLLRRGQKSQALRYFRDYKRLKMRADSLFVKLKSIKRILDQLAQSQTDKMVLQAYQAGVDALRLSLKDLTVVQSLVTVELADNLMDQIQELCDTQDEVNEIISRGVTAADEDMDDLEEELMALLDEASVD